MLTALIILPFSISSQNSPISYSIVGNDTLATMSISSARILLKNVLGGQISDSLVSKYEIKDSVSQSMINAQKTTIIALDSKNSNLDSVIVNQSQVIGNLNLLNDHKDQVNDDLLKVQKKLRKEVRRQVILKKIALIGCVVLPVLVLLL